MTETQARDKLRKLLAITLDRGAAPGEQANATRAIGMILQAHPNLRDMIAGRYDPAEVQAEARENASAWAFWKGLFLGAGGVAVALGALVLASLAQRRHDL